MTQVFLKEANKLKSDAGKQMSNGKTLNEDSMENTFAMTSQKVGFCQGINEVIDIPDYSEEE